MWGWDHLSLPFFHFLFAFCLIFVTPRSLSQFFPGKKLLPYFNGYALTAWILASVSCACLCSLNENPLNLCDMHTNICTCVRVCTWVCSKANRVREPIWFILLQLLLHPQQEKKKKKDRFSFANSVIRKLGITSNPARGSHLQGIIHPVCFGQVLGWAESLSGSACLQASREGGTHLSS